MSDRNPPVGSRTDAPTRVLLDTRSATAQPAPVAQQGSHLRGRRALPMQAHNAELSEERDKLRADAERYRWLKSQPIKPGDVQIDVVLWGQDDTGDAIRGDELDAAIDAARGEKS